mmetsp:Transcript_123165/g.393740  ORF Transcript_123165/g.393740 Transcript_123165/m.393740 type:complete len:214 (-) Transcript_123165:593-1234(-)
MEAARPASTPFGASSKTSTRLDSGAPPSKRRAASKKISGSGLDLLTWSPVTMWCIRPKSSRWRPVLKSKCRLWEDVATAMGTPCLCKCRTNRSTPGISFASAKSLSKSCSRSLRKSSALISPSKPKSSIKICTASKAFLPIIFAFKSHVNFLPKRSKISCWATVYALSVSSSNPSMSKRMCVAAGATARSNSERKAAMGKPSMESRVPSMRSR